MLTRIASTHNLQSLTLHGAFVDPPSAAAVFASDHFIDGSHSLLPHLEAFRFLVADKGEFKLNTLYITLPFISYGKRESSKA